MKKWLLAILVIAPVMASAQTDLVVTPSNAVDKISTSMVGSYDRVETHFSMEAGNWYLIALPAALDGYYFGADAKRYKLNCTLQSVVSSGTNNASNVDNINKVEMADLDDFAVGNLYLVKPTIDIDKIFHLSAGLKTNITKSDVGKEYGISAVSSSTDVNNVEANGADAEGFSSGCYKVYDLYGRAVKEIKQGEVYIINGKKVKI